MNMDKDYLLTAIRAALIGGSEIMKVYDDPKSDFEIERKADNSPLTIADRRSHAVIADMLAGTPFPVLSEEGRMIPYAERREWKELWVVDPLDGTKEFIKRNGEFTVNIAYVHEGVPEAGVIYVPVKRVLYFADFEIGAYRTEALDDVSSLEGLIRNSEKLPLGLEKDVFTVVASRSHLNEETSRFIHKIEQEHGEVDVVSKGSSLKLCLVAEGLADVYPRFAPTMEWDTAAGHAIVRAAGKEVYDASAGCGVLRYNKEDLHNSWFIVR